MTLGKLKEVIQENNIPDDATLMSDSGWECDATDIDGVYYNEAENIIVFTQERESKYDHNPYRPLYFLKGVDINGMVC